MLDLEDLHKTWSIIEKNKYMKTDAATPEMLAVLTEDDADIVKRINLLFDMMAEAQEKVFGPIVEKALRKD